MGEFAADQGQRRVIPRPTAKVAAKPIMTGRMKSLDPMASTRPDLKTILARPPVMMTRQAVEGSIWPLFARLAVERVMASMSVRPEMAATVNRPASPKCLRGWSGSH